MHDGRIFVLPDLLAPDLLQDGQADPHTALSADGGFAMTTVSVPSQVAARYDGPIIVQKGPHDAMSDGKHSVVCNVDGSPRRAGGQVRHCSQLIIGVHDDSKQATDCL